VWRINTLCGMPINIERGSMIKDLLRALFSGSRTFGRRGIFGYIAMKNMVIINTMYIIGDRSILLVVISFSIVEDT